MKEIPYSGEATAKVDEIEIVYDTFGDSSDPPMLLIMGLGGQMIRWDEAFCQQLAARGHWVIRFDNRDVGL
ncbi:MAG: alpha/beta fold hydrolase, partial [Candidatus Thorarchaeota archaeon]